jgi:hypothetical protein
MWSNSSPFGKSDFLFPYARGLTILSLLVSHKPAFSPDVHVGDLRSVGRDAGLVSLLVSLKPTSSVCPVPSGFIVQMLPLLSKAKLPFGPGKAAWAGLVSTLSSSSSSSQATTVAATTPDNLSVFVFVIVSLI